MNQITPFLEFQVCYMNNFKLLTFYYHVLRAEKVLIYRNEHVQIRKNNYYKRAQNIPHRKLLLWSVHIHRSYNSWKIFGYGPETIRVL